ncbi:3-isopropylmalate dehydratase small subunit [Buchnera aphidicola]|uniref:3-isopropylmalate dehydratase small subunit n=1 Tax=Buchnera aphidicola TaxID=9 RepID=UPI0031B8766D
MKKFINHTGIIVPLDISNVDTDAIIPKQFLHTVNRTGFSESLFYNWRFIKGDKKQVNKSFVLNKICYQSASILITRNNFGCGSSREHAVWALLDYGFKVIISSKFADIFYNNSFNNHLLLITLSENFINEIFNIIFNQPGIQATVNLLDNSLVIENKKYDFFVDDFYRKCLLNGVDNIDLTLRNINKIKKYEKRIPNFFLNIK